VEQISTVFMEVVADLCASKKLLLPMICCTKLGEGKVKGERT
jgi:hypothetical protein